MAPVARHKARWCGRRATVNGPRLDFGSSRARASASASGPGLSESFETRQRRVVWAAPRGRWGNGTGGAPGSLLVDEGPWRFPTAPSLRALCRHRWRGRDGGVTCSLGRDGLGEGSLRSRRGGDRARSADSLTRWQGVAWSRRIALSREHSSASDSSSALGVPAVNEIIEFSWRRRRARGWS